MLRSGIDRVIATLARVLLLGFYRRVEIDGRSRIPRGRPVMVVANHFNGFVDPVLVVAALGRLPRFLAKATLWKVVPARPFLALAGVVPVYRAEDGATGGNARTFARCAAVFRRGGTVALFPEGTTHDDLRLAKVRTGAARIALGSRAVGTEGLLVLPVGIVFDDKVALRSGVLIRVGEPVELDALVSELRPDAPDADDTDHALVRAVSTRIADALGEVSGDYDDWKEAARLRFAAEVAIRRDGSQDVTLAEREDLAQRLAHADDTEREELLDALGRYALDLDHVRLTDRQVLARAGLGRAVGRLAVNLVMLAVLAPFLVTGVVVNLAPWWAVWVSGAAIRVPVTKGTVRFLVALVAFPASWWIWAYVVLGRRGWAVPLAMLAFLVLGLATVWLVERWWSLIRDWGAWATLRNRRALVDQLLPDRVAVVAAVAQVTAGGVAGSGEDGYGSQSARRSDRRGVEQSGSSSGS